MESFPPILFLRLDPATIEQNMRGYLRVCAQFTQPRSNMHKRPKYQTLIQRRQNLLYWGHRCVPEINHRKLCNALQEVYPH
jgi:hypothetical protein